jgi:putative copper resistance protein D
VIAFVKAASGHAADDGILTLTELCQFLHIVSTAVWAGAILVSGFLIAPRLFLSARIAALWSYSASLSKTVTWALATLVISGIYTSDRELNNSFAALRTSTWGRILIVKLIFVAATIVLGGMNRFLCINRPATRPRSILLKRMLLAEGVLMVFILCLSGLLGSTAPPMADM